jgi:hypothetical protein
MTATIVAAAIQRRKFGQRNATHVTTNSEAAAPQQNMQISLCIHSSLRQFYCINSQADMPVVLTEKLSELLHCIKWPIYVNVELEL